MAAVSDTKQAALQLVNAGGIQYGAEYPNLARRHGLALDVSFLVDGAGVYAGQHATFEALERGGLIAIRHDLIAMVDGQPADPGWRAAVELTAIGRAALSDLADDAAVSAGTVEEDVLGAAAAFGGRAAGSSAVTGSVTRKCGENPEVEQDNR